MTSKKNFMVSKKIFMASKKHFMTSKKHFMASKKHFMAYCIYKHYINFKNSIKDIYQHYIK